MATRQSTKVERICETCDKLFFVKPSDIKAGGGRFCSRPCTNKARVCAPTEVRMARFVAPPDENGCILWTGNKIKGYGGIQIGGRNGKPCYAHRVAWELANGPIPDGLWVLHKCDVPACVNPDHLFLGTQTDNMTDMALKGRHWATRITKAQADEMRSRYANGTPTRVLATEYGVSEDTIWRHIRNMVHFTKRKPDDPT